MVEMINNYIKLKQTLDENDYEEIKALEKLCLENDKIALKLEVDFKLSSSQGRSHNTEDINEFMYYNGDNIIAYLGICYFGGDAMEVNGMVHPDYRRRGIFKKLFTLLMDEWGKRNIPKMLLLSDNNSIAGLEFIKTTTAAYHNSEYEMFLRNNLNQKALPGNVRLREAERKDAREITLQNSIYFGIEFKEEDIATALEEGDTMINYMAEINDKIIGKVNLQLCNGVGGIYGLGVLPEYRGKGYGREILALGIEKLKGQNPADIMLQVATKNKTALNLYKSCGFEETSQMNYYKLSK